MYIYIYNIDICLCVCPSPLVHVIAMRCVLWYLLPPYSQRQKHTSYCTLTYTKYIIKLMYILQLSESKDSDMFRYLGCNLSQVDGYLTLIDIIIDIN